MIRLTIKNPDGSLYWQTHFGSQEDCLAWLEVEKTRPYWKEDFQIEIKNLEEENVS